MNSNNAVSNSKKTSEIVKSENKEIGKIPYLRKRKWCKIPTDEDEDFNCQVYHVSLLLMKAMNILKKILNSFMQNYLFLIIIFHCNRLQNDYVLQKLLKNSALHSALQHDQIAEGIAEERLIEDEANEIAKQASDYLKLTKRYIVNLVF